MERLGARGGFRLVSPERCNEGEESGSRYGSFVQRQEKLHVLLGQSAGKNKKVKIVTQPQFHLSCDMLPAVEVLSV